jgi:osmoprotectant transport system permease protein
MSYLTSHPFRVAALALGHVELVALALAVALVFAIPLGVYAARRPRAAPWLLGTLGAIYTIPSLALLGVLVLAFGLGFLPIFVALVVYAQFMLARSVAAGINGIDRAQVDAARGAGMSSSQILMRVELPQALPVLIGGVRIAAIAMIAIATLGGYVGGVGLGVLIFNGLTLHQSGMIVAGSVAASGLAIAVDGALRFVERRASYEEFRLSKSPEPKGAR